MAEAGWARLTVNSFMLAREIGLSRTALRGLK